MSWLTREGTRDGTAEPVSRDQILRRGWGQGNIQFPCSADHEQDWQPCPVDPYSAFIFPVQLNTSRIGNLTRLIPTLLYVMTIHIEVMSQYTHRAFLYIEQSVFICRKDPQSLSHPYCIVLAVPVVRWYSLV